MTLILCFLAVGLICVCALALYLNHQMQVKWMRIFSVQQGISPKSMELEREEPKTPLTQIPRRKFSVQIPGVWRDVPKQVTKQ
jgi:hypothetical protein